MEDVQAGGMLARACLRKISHLHHHAAYLTSAATAASAQLRHAPEIPADKAGVLDSADATTRKNKKAGKCALHCTPSDCDKPTLLWPAGTSSCTHRGEGHRWTRDAQLSHCSLVPNPDRELSCETKNEATVLVDGMYKTEDGMCRPIAASGRDVSSHSHETNDSVMCIL
jgi:hypothetical protein